MGIQFVFPFVTNHALLDYIATRPYNIMHGKARFLHQQEPATKCVGADKEFTKFLKVKQHLRRQDPADPEYVWARRAYHLHQKRMKEMEPIVDSRSPYIPTITLTSDRVFGAQCANFFRMERENAVLVGRIKAIFAGHSHADPQHDFVSLPIHNTRNKVRQNRILNEVQQNYEIYKRLQAIEPTYSRTKQLDWYEQQKRHLNRSSRYPIPAPAKAHKIEKFCGPLVTKAYKRAKKNPRPIVFMDIEATDTICGRILIELMADICPLTSENFRSLCTGKPGASYICSSITHIRPGIFWRGGGENNLNSIYGGPFPNENYKIKHDEPGILSMTSQGLKTGNVEFQISAVALPPLNGHYVAFGKVIQGMDFLTDLANESRPFENGRLRIITKITACGETTLAEKDNIPPPRLFKDQKDEVLLEREVTAIIKLRHKVQKVRAELDRLKRRKQILANKYQSKG